MDSRNIRQNCIDICPQAQEFFPEIGWEKSEIKYEIRNIGEPEIHLKCTAKFGKKLVKGMATYPLKEFRRYSYHKLDYYHWEWNSEDVDDYEVIFRRVWGTVIIPERWLAERYSAFYPQYEMASPILQDGIVILKIPTPIHKYFKIYELKKITPKMLLELTGQYN